MANSKYREHPGKTMGASNFLHWFGDKFLRLRYNVTYEVLDEQIYEQVKDGPVLMVAKHSRNIDIPLGYSAMVNLFARHAWCVMKQSLTKAIYFDYFWKIGGIPLDRDNPDRSKHYLLYARKKLYENNMMVLFPEQTVYPWKMGEGKIPGFRFISGKPKEPLAVVPIGFEYVRGLPRRKLVMRFGEVMHYAKTEDPAVFMHKLMTRVAELSGLEYPYPAPEPRKQKVLS